MAPAPANHAAPALRLRLPSPDFNILVLSLDVILAAFLVLCENILNSLLHFCLLILFVSIYCS